MEVNIYNFIYNILKDFNTLFLYVVSKILDNDSYEQHLCDGGAYIKKCVMLYDIYFILFLILSRFLNLFTVFVEL
jgi:hypothetical protein